MGSYNIGSQRGKPAKPMRMPVWFIAHGAGPMPILGNAMHAKLIEHLKSLAATLSETPKAVLVISAHWEEAKATVTTSASPPMLYDYYGFPPEVNLVNWRLIQPL